jgi:hypothetical protein
MRILRKNKSIYTTQQAMATLSLYQGGGIAMAIG